MTKQIEDIKKLYDSLKSAINIVDNILMKKNIIEKNDSTIQKAIEMDLILFSLYFTYTDKKITLYECDIINNVLEQNFTAVQLNNLADYYEIKNKNFETTIPVSINILLEIDKMALSVTPDLEMRLCDIFTLLYKHYGLLLISSDNIIDTNNVVKVNKYIEFLNNYIKDKSNQNGKIISNNNIEDNNTSLNNLLNDLNCFIGLSQVKYEVLSMVNLIKIRKLKESKGIPIPDLSMHLVFSGNPGTGKTTVARLLAQIYKELGVLSKGHFIEVDRSGLVGGYVGQTALKVKEVIENARGGVLFIDEAYSLTYNRQENDYGYEAVDTLLKAMEDYRDDLIVIVAGYTERMNEFILSNPGLKSRFNKYIYFNDYSAEEMYAIFQKFCSDYSYTLTSQADEYIKQLFIYLYTYRNVKTFANAREVRNIFEKAITNQANRIVNIQEITKSELTKLSIEDISNITI